MLTLLIKPMECPKCSGSKWASNIEIGHAHVKGLEKIPHEEKKVPVSKRVEKILIKEFKRIQELQAQVEYTCETCGYILGKEKLK